jgi:hypothetical protein
MVFFEVAQSKKRTPACQIASSGAKASIKPDEQLPVTRCGHYDRADFFDELLFGVVGD